MKNLSLKMLIIISALAVLTGSVYLTVWVWNILPKWLFFSLCGLDIVFSFWYFRRDLKQ